MESGSNPHHEPVGSVGDFTFFNQLCERLEIDHLTDGFPHFLHNYSDATCALIGAVGTGAVRAATHTIDRGQWAVDDSNNAADGDFGRRFVQDIASPLATPTFENSAVPQFQQNGFQKLPRYLLGGSNLFDWYRPFTVALG